MSRTTTTTKHTPKSTRNARRTLLPIALLRMRRRAPCTFRWRHLEHVEPNQTRRRRRRLPVARSLTLKSSTFQLSANQLPLISSEAFVNIRLAEVSLQAKAISVAPSSIHCPLLARSYSLKTPTCSTSNRYTQTLICTLEQTHPLQCAHSIRKFNHKLQ